MHVGLLPYPCNKNETMDPLRVATLTAQREYVALFHLLVWPHEVDLWFHY